jgi:alpha-L-fucosidase 2
MPKHSLALYASLALLLWLTAFTPVRGDSSVAGGNPEWLLQQSGGEIKLLPALPPHLADGQVTNLQADGFVIDLVWRDSRLQEAVVRSLHGDVLRLRLGPGGPWLISNSGRPADVTQIEPGLLQWQTEAGVRYTISPGRTVPNSSSE